MTEFVFQNKGIEWLKGRERSLLADEPGLGKSRQALMGVGDGRVLVVSPGILQETWEDEVARWRPDWSPLNWSWTTYQRLFERKENEKGHWILATDRPRREYRGFDTLIFDECHHLKNRKVNQSGAAEKLARDAGKVIFLTGTPVPNWSHELYNILKMLNPGDRRWTNYWRWINEWYNTWQPPWGGTKIGGLQTGLTWGDFIRGNELDRSMLRRERGESGVDLPPLLEQTIFVDMVPAQRKLYQALKRDFIAWVDESGLEVSAWSSGALYTKLSQIVTGVEIVDPMASGSGKFDALRELLDSLRGNPVVIFTQYRATAKRAAEIARITHGSCGLIMGGIAESGQIARDFQNGKIGALVGTLDKISEGLTLTRADHCIFVEHSWRPSKNEQAMRRLHRISQTRPVTVTHLVTKDSIDVHMQQVLKSKTDAQIDLFTANDLLALV